MTELREQAIEMIREIPDDKIIYVVNILKNVKDLSGKNQNSDELVTGSAELLEHLEKYRGRLPEDFDYKKELAGARDEKYADFG